MSRAQGQEATYRITTKGYVAALIVQDGIVMQAAPILRHYVGRPWEIVKKDLRQRANIGQLDIENLSGGNDNDD